MADITFHLSRVEPGYILDAIRGARLSYGSQGRMDSALDGGALTIGPVDRAFVEQRIAVGGIGEDKLLRTIPVSVFVTAPLRWWVEMDTYRMAPPDGPITAVASTTARQSSSLMHRLASRGAFTADDFTPTTDPRLIDIANEKYAAWVAAGGRRHFRSREWEELQDAISRGYRYTSHWYANYAVLRNIYGQRRAHRQGEWRAFCAWAETLPESWMITYERPGKNDAN